LPREVNLGPARREDRPFGPCHPSKALIESGGFVVCGEVFVKLRARHVILVFAMAAAAAASMSVNAPAASAAHSLPDLGMGRLSQFQITNSGGRRLLRFTTDIVNVGVGPFEVRSAGQGGSSGPDWSARQCIYNDVDNTCTEYPTAAVTFYSGDGHNHRHVRNLQKMELTPLGSTNVVGRVAKIGYCFYDNLRYRLSLPYAPANVVFRSNACGTSSSTSIAMGLSVGWGDRYPYNIAYQYIDITGLAAGNYKLTVTADPEGWFQEVTRNNNSTWVDLYLARPGYSSRVLRYGPAA
jgi:hypothetical protein